MANYDIGDLLRLQMTLTNINGGLVTDATVTLTIKKPDDTITTPSVTNAGAGVYYGELTLDQSGFHYYRFLATGTAGAAKEGTFHVIPSNVL